MIKPRTYPCEHCSKPGTLDEAGEVRIPTKVEQYYDGDGIRVLCKPCYRKWDEY